jgi:hypothetical protein
MATTIPVAERRVNENPPESRTIRSPRRTSDPNFEPGYSLGVETASHAIRKNVQRTEGRT